MELSNLNIKNGLCISLGANIDSNYGKPIESLIICKPKIENLIKNWINQSKSFEKEICLLYTSPSPRDRTRSRMPSSA